MSREFVPGKGLVSASKQSPERPAASQRAAADSAPYWSPATKFNPQPRPEPAAQAQWGFDAPASDEQDREFGDDLDWGVSGASLPAPPKRTLQTVGIPEPIRQHFRSLDIAALKQMPPDDERYKELPSRYSCAFPLDDPKSQRRAGGSFGYPSAVFRVTDNTDSNVYVVRRLDAVRTTQTVVQNALQKWVGVRHPCIVSLYAVLADKGALFFTHAYHPAAQTLKQRFVDQRGAPLAEALLWRVLTQLLLGIRAAHAHGVAVRAIGLTRILVTSGTKIRISCAGVPDVVEFESRRMLGELQADDLMKLGVVMLSLAARTAVSANMVHQAMGLARSQYSPSFTQILDALLSGQYSKVAAVCSMVPADRWCDELDISLAASDGLHSHLRSEYECGRTVKLLLKLGMINERPEQTLAGARDWSETGDRYVLKLFRDFLFHQTQLDGTCPSLDAGHVISSLNKLDMGDQEKILLSSKNNKDLLVVSFADVNR
jgi:PAB-dependent poly(A)-specific ribonuclease subunit 3